MLALRAGQKSLADRAAYLEEQVDARTIPVRRQRPVQTVGIAGMAVDQQAGMDRLIGQKRRPPFRHRGFGHMGQALILLGAIRAA